MSALEALHTRCRELADRVTSIPAWSAAFDVPEAELICKQIRVLAYSLQRVAAFLATTDGQRSAVEIDAERVASRLLLALGERVEQLEAFHRRGQS